jgi:hypothetical protein
MLVCPSLNVTLVKAPPSINCHANIAFPSTIYSVDYGHNVGIALCCHIQCASLNCHVGITFNAPTYSVDWGYNVVITFCPHMGLSSPSLVFLF